MFSKKKRPCSFFRHQAAIGTAVATALAAGAMPVFAANTVSISNGGLSVTFDLTWGAVVTGVANTNVANGLNIVDSHDVGRELQTDQFLYNSTTPSSSSLVSNPTQAGALGHQAYYQHPNGTAITEVGSPVVSYSATASQFQAVITPLDYDTGTPSDWVYVENVSINNQCVATFKYTCYDYQPQSYTMNSEIPTLYSDYTNAFMYPNANGTTTTVTGSLPWPQPKITSNGWIGNLDTTNNLGVFYTTPNGVEEGYGTFSGASITPGSSGPLGKTNAAERLLTATPGEILTTQFSVVVGTQTSGASLIAQQAPASFTLSNSLITNGVFSANAPAYTQSTGNDGAGSNPANPTGWLSSGGNTGVNGPDTTFSTTNSTPFAPSSTAGVTDFAFLENQGASISQSVATVAHTTYTLTFDGAAASSEAAAVLEVIITDASGGQQIYSFTPSITDSAFTPFFLNFTATSGLTNIEFLNNSASGNYTVDVSNVSLAAVPEPASLGLLAFGGLALLLISRKHAACGPQESRSR